jgi:hypothetical protein
MSPSWWWKWLLTADFPLGQQCFIYGYSAGARGTIYILDAIPGNDAPIKAERAGAAELIPGVARLSNILADHRIGFCSGNS